MTLAPQLCGQLCEVVWQLSPLSFLLEAKTLGLQRVEKLFARQPEPGICADRQCQIDFATCGGRDALLSESLGDQPHQ